MQLNHLNRYTPVLEHIAGTTVTRVLDVGCGSLGMGEFTSVPFVGCDMSFAAAPAATMTPIRGSAINLPFSDDSFDLVVSLDMLEHLPPQTRAVAVGELLRVSRGAVIFGCPCGSSAWNSDVRLSKCFSALHLRMPAWLSEHMIAPFSTRTELEAVLDKGHLQYNVLYNESIWIHQAVIMADILLFGWLLRPSMLLGASLRRWLPSTLSRLCLRLRVGPPYRWIFVVDMCSGINWAGAGPGDEPLGSATW